MAVDISRIYRDLDLTDEIYRPDSNGIILNGNRGKLFAIVSKTAGKGPHPVIVMCHGIPGNDGLSDFAMNLRKAGFCTITFHYSGCWGSEGVYSLNNCFEDADTVLEYVNNNEDGIFDTDNIFILGHSLGGMVGAYAAAKHDEVKAAVLIMPAGIGQLYARSKTSEEERLSCKEIFDDFGRWLNSFDYDAMAAECEREPDKYLLTSYAEGLSKKPVLGIAGKFDELIPREEHIDVLEKAVRKCGGTCFECVTFPTDHGMNDQRNNICIKIADFFGKNIKNS